jgi:tRNA (guanine37-N1)-methyltransferase
MKFRDALKEVLTKDELAYAVTSFDVVGDIAIIEIPEELVLKEKIIANTLLTLLKHVKVILKKKGIHHGTYRLQNYTVIAGEKRKTTIHKESGVRLKLNVEKSYFSARSSNERLRIASLVKKDESILVMFSGISPFPLVMAYNAKPKDITAIELNPDAHEYALFNTQKNKCGKIITPINGDVTKEVPKLGRKFDRIVMPLPKSAEEFLATALNASRKGTRLHLYQFGREDDIPAMKKVLRDLAVKAGHQIRILKTVKAGVYSPKVYRLCFDTTVLK